MQAYRAMMMCGAMACLAAPTDKGSAPADKGSAEAPPPVAPPGELPADVVAQIEAAASNLEAANEEIAGLKATVADRDTEIGELKVSVGRLEGALEAYRTMPQAIPGELLTGIAQPARRERQSRPAPAPEVRTRDLVAKVTVLKGSVEHPRADNGSATVGDSFTVTDAEAGELVGLRDRGVLSIEAA